MGGEKFDSTHPEGYLFGENTDLNFLGTRPVAVGAIRATLEPGVCWLSQKCTSNLRGRADIWLKVEGWDGEML